MKKRIQSDSEDNNSDIEDMDEEESLMDADANFFGYQNKHQQDDNDNLQKNDKNSDSPSPQGRITLNSHFTLNLVQGAGAFAMPLIKSGASLQSDMKFGWKPQIEITGAPIPLYYDFEPFTAPINPQTNKDMEALYYGPRYKHSLQMHKAFANITFPDGRKSYPFKDPPNMSLIKQIIRQTHIPETPRSFLGMNPQLKGEDLQNELVFDSNFESGNLDMVIKRKEMEYDLYMRVDTNTKGHHQWFYFSVEYNNSIFVGKKVRFNIVNFTKGHSLYTQGMRICICKKSGNYQWIKGGEEIQYKLSHISRQTQNPQKQYFMTTFVYEFTEQEDKIFFSYCFPYDFSKLCEFLASQRLLAKTLGGDFLKETVLCQSLGGVDVPMLTITSRLTSDPENFQTVKLQEFQDSSSRISLPFYKKKKNIIVCARVHPGESNSSYMMQGFIKYLMSNSLQARELRKRCVFKIVPMTNPDGVIVGNYRTNMAGNDLNRKYLNPDDKLHPTVCAIKKLVSDLTYPNGDTEADVPESQRVFAFIDMHGHSRKKNVFIYGPYYPLHHDRYLKMRILPKLLSEETNKFRFFSCKFRIERSKEKAARIVLWREFNIMNCFTFEASFHGYLNNERTTEEFTPDILESMGEHLVNALYEYFLILEEEDRQKKLRELNKKKKKKKTQLESTSTSQQQMSQTAIEGGFQQTSKKKKSLQNIIRQQTSKKVTPRLQLVNIQEERDEDDNNGQMNPNEPPTNIMPETPIRHHDRDSEFEESKVSISLEGGPQQYTKNKGNSTGIRSMKQMLQILKAEEIKHKQRETVDLDEEEQESSEDDKNNTSPVKGPKKNDSGSDSDPLEDELTGKQQAQLYNNILGTIDQFHNCFNKGNPLKKLGELTKIKRKSTNDQQRNSKSPIPSQAPNKETSPQKKNKSIDETNAQPKRNKSIVDEIKSNPYQVVQKVQNKVQAFVAHTNLELFARQPIPTTKAPVPQFNPVKQANYGLPSHSFNQILKETKQSQKLQFANSLIINKIGTDHLGSKELQPQRQKSTVTAKIVSTQPEVQTQVVSNSIFPISQSQMPQHNLSYQYLTQNELSAQARSFVMDGSQPNYDLLHQFLSPQEISIIRQQQQYEHHQKFVRNRQSMNNTPGVQFQSNSELQTIASGISNNIVQGVVNMNTKKRSTHEMLNETSEEVYNIKRKQVRHSMLQKNRFGSENVSVEPFSSSPFKNLDPKTIQNLGTPQKQLSPLQFLEGAQQASLQPILNMIVPPSTAGSFQTQFDDFIQNSSQIKKSAFEQRRRNNQSDGDQIEINQQKQGKSEGQRSMKIAQMMKGQELNKLNSFTPQDNQLQINLQRQDDQFIRTHANEQQYSSNLWQLINQNPSSQIYMNGINGLNLAQQLYNNQYSNIIPPINELNNSAFGSFNTTKSKQKFKFQQQQTQQLQNQHQQQQQQPLNYTLKKIVAQQESPSVKGSLPKQAFSTMPFNQGETSQKGFLSKRGISKKETLTATLEAQKLIAKPKQGNNSFVASHIDSSQIKKHKAKLQKQHEHSQNNTIEKSLNNIAISHHASKETIQSKSKQNQNFEEICLPNPMQGKKRTSRQNMSFGHDSKGHESVSSNQIRNDQQYEYLMGSDIKRHAKFQHIIDTLLSDQYPVQISIAHSTDINHQFRSNL